ncbi:hypothetical protein RN001_004514 [Aquatica leii]|uniref:RRM domain-containing protein n=1 Tax=Aquatica leii TaxID=1421715 RepID=A0AAN7Q5V8_9COLE|nr:hypothetical protein RN001_004514 [Aquatica leii]
MVESMPLVKTSNMKTVKKPFKKKFSQVKHGWVYIGHIPHGFYEEEMTAYFEQFGKIINVRVCRSRKTGKSKGYGFIEFADEGVAKIAATTMHNYLMFKKRLDAKFIPAEKMRKYKMSKGTPWSEQNYPLKQIRKDANAFKNAHRDDATYLKKCRHYIAHYKKSIEKLQTLGIDYTFTPVDVPPELADKI